MKMVPRSVKGKSVLKVTRQRRDGSCERRIPSEQKVACESRRDPVRGSCPQDREVFGECI